MRRRPLYSACNEDTRSEIRALAPTCGDTVVAIAAGGGRALSMLSTTASRVIAVDRRLDQVFSTELKAAAVENLAYREFREFVGVDSSAARREVYFGIRPSLGLRCRRYWDARLDLIDEGVIYVGRLERALSRFCASLRKLGLFGWPGQIMRSESVAEQLGLIRENVGSVRAGSVYWSVYCSPVVTWLAMQDPSFLRCSEGNLGAYLFRRFLEFAKRRLARESFFLHLIYYGRYAREGPLPVYLSVDEYERVRSNLSRLEIRNCRIEDVLSQVGRQGSMKWSLSDISCWMTEKDFHIFLTELALQFQAGDRVCYRNFGLLYGLPSEARQRIVRLDELCDHVEALDTSVFFRIEVAESR